MQPDESVEIGERELVLYCYNENYGGLLETNDYNESVDYDGTITEQDSSFEYSDYTDINFTAPNDTTASSDTVDLCSLYWSEGMYDNHQVPMALAYGLFAAVGMCSNFVIFYVLISEHRGNQRKTPSQAFVLSLCLADTFQLSSLPFKMDVRLWWGCWRYGKIACVFHNSVTNINLFVSVFFLVMLSIDRYVVIMPPDKLKCLKKARAHPHYVVVTTLMIWSCAFLLAIPTLTHSIFTNNQCTVKWARDDDAPIEEAHICRICSRNKTECANATLTEAQHTYINETYIIPKPDYCTADNHIELIHSSCFCPTDPRYKQVYTTKTKNATYPCSTYQVYSS